MSARSGKHHQFISFGFFSSSSCCYTSKLQCTNSGIRHPVRRNAYKFNLLNKTKCTNEKWWKTSADARDSRHTIWMNDSLPFLLTINMSHTQSNAMQPKWIQLFLFLVKDNRISNSKNIRNSSCITQFLVLNEFAWKFPPFCISCHFSYSLLSRNILLLGYVFSKQSIIGAIAVSVQWASKKVEYMRKQDIHIQGGRVREDDRREEMWYKTQF